MDRAYTITEFCQLYKIGRTKTYQEINSGRLKAVKSGSKTIIRTDDAETWLASLKPSDPHENKYPSAQCSELHSIGAVE